MGAAKLDMQVRELPRAHADRMQGQRVGRMAGWCDGPLVDYPGNPHGYLPARSLVRLDRATVEQAVADEREVLLVFDAERGDAPIIVGLLEPDRTEEAPGRQMPPIEAHVDGRRVVLEAQDEIVLRCGSASITLRRNGRVVVRGAYVETCSEGVNRIKGGSVRIN